MFHQPNWWERRMDRLDTWDRHHGYPVEKAMDATKFVTGCTLLAAGAVAGVVAYLYLNGSTNGQSKYKTPFTDDLGYPLPLSN